jgi:hypothetical protein
VLRLGELIMRCCFSFRGLKQDAWWHLGGVPRQGSVTENKFMHTSANYKLGRKASGDGDVTPAREGAHVLSPGDSFGQLALMHSLPSTSTITAMDTEVHQAHVHPEGPFQRWCGPTDGTRLRTWM